MCMYSIDDLIYYFGSSPLRIFCIWTSWGFGYFSRWSRRHSLSVSILWSISTFWVSNDVTCHHVTLAHKNTNTQTLKVSYKHTLTHTYTVTLRHTHTPTNCEYSGQNTIFFTTVGKSEKRCLCHVFRGTFAMVFNMLGTNTWYVQRFYVLTSYWLLSWLIVYFPGFSPNIQQLHIFFFCQV